jgi:hypothetical protein
MEDEGETTGNTKGTILERWRKKGSDGGLWGTKGERICKRKTKRE